MFKYVFPMIMLAVAVMLFMDASMFALYRDDPVTGRIGECYTTI